MSEPIDRGSREPHKPCNCVDCEIRHGDQADPDDVVLEALREEVATLKKEVFGAEESASRQRNRAKTAERLLAAESLHIASLEAERDTLKAEVTTLALSWIPPEIARKAVADASEAMREACARVAGERADEANENDASLGIASLISVARNENAQLLEEYKTAQADSMRQVGIIRELQASLDGARSEASATRRERDAERAERNALTWAIAEMAQESCNGHNGIQLLRVLAFQKEQAVKAEREVCLDLAFSIGDGACSDCAPRFAGAIRARGSK